MQKWLARFAFSFVVLAAILIWEGYKLSRPGVTPEPWRWVLCFMGAGACAALAVAGIRARHRESK